MGARSEAETVDHPWPVVYDAFVRSLPTKGYRITALRPERGQLDVERRNTRLTVAVGAVDAVTSEWVATSELRIGLFRDRHDQHFAEIRDALHAYLGAYYA